jgi:hypothetical protein
MKYGTPLQTNNGRDALMDAYQEACDMVMYLRQAIAERDEKEIVDAGYKPCCPVCGCTETIGHYFFGAESLVSCQNCGVARMDWPDE